MKRVIVLRHADREGDELTPFGIEACKQLAQKLPHFDIVVASPAKRTQQTAELLTGTKPKIDARATIASGQAAGEDLLALAKELIENLPENCQALVVTHETNILALINLLDPHNTVVGINQLDGMSLGENMKLEMVNNGN